jgi:hypothetical protein
LKMGKAQRARLRRPAEVAFLLRLHAQLRGRILSLRGAGNGTQESEHETKNQERRRPGDRLSTPGADALESGRPSFHAHFAYSPPDVLGAALSATANASA